MSNSRKLKFRTVPRAPRYPPHNNNNKHVEPVPLANKFQELIEQDELSPSHSSKPPAQRPVIHTSPTTTSMAQHLQDLLEVSASANNRSSSDGIQRNNNNNNNNVAGVAESLRKDESEAVDSDTSDHEDWTKSSAKVVLPMGHRLQELLQGDSSGSTIQDKPKLRQKGKRQIESNFELKSLFKEDDIEACDYAQMGAPNHPPVVIKPQPLPRIAEQFQEALMAAPSFDCASLPSVQFPVNQDYSTRLQRLLQLEKQQHAEITKGLPLNTSLESILVQVTKKSLEGRLTTCKCQVVQAPSKWMGASFAWSSRVDQVQVIFNSKVAAELEIDVGCTVRINPPWREVTLLGSTTRVILCTYFCEAVY